MGAYVALLEYNGIEGMILLSELSRRRIRSITKLIKVGAAAARLQQGSSVRPERWQTEVADWEPPWSTQLSAH